jgi:hypothetical protein
MRMHMRADVLFDEPSRRAGESLDVQAMAWGRNEGRADLLAFI